MSRPNPNRHAPLEIDEHPRALAPEFRVTPEQLRAIIKGIAPDCTERVSHKIPIFRLKKDLVAISAAKNPCSLHAMSKAIPDAVKDELKAARVLTSGTTPRTRTGIRVPLSLLERVLRSRLAELEGGR